MWFLVVTKFIFTCLTHQIQTVQLWEAVVLLNIFRLIQSPVPWLYYTIWDETSLTTCHCHYSTLREICLTRHYYKDLVWLVMGCKAVGYKTVGDCWEIILNDCPLNPPIPRCVPGLARPQHLAAHSQKHYPDFLLSAVVTQIVHCSASTSLRFCRAS